MIERKVSTHAKVKNPATYPWSKAKIVAVVNSHTESPLRFAVNNVRVQGNVVHADPLSVTGEFNNVWSVDFFDETTGTEIGTYIFFEAWTGENLSIEFTNGFMAWTVTHEG